MEDFPAPDDLERQVATKVRSRYLQLGHVRVSPQRGEHNGTGETDADGSSPRHGPPSSLSPQQRSRVSPRRGSLSSSPLSVRRGSLSSSPLGVRRGSLSNSPLGVRRGSLSSPPLGVRRGSLSSSGSRGGSEAARDATSSSRLGEARRGSTFEEGSRGVTSLTRTPTFQP